MPMTQKDKDRAKYLRKKYPSDAEMNTLDILLKYPKNKPMTAIQRVQKQREKERKELSKILQILK